METPTGKEGGGKGKQIVGVIGIPYSVANPCLLNIDRSRMDVRTLGSAERALCAASGDD